VSNGNETNDLLEFDTLTFDPDDLPFSAVYELEKANGETGLYEFTFLPNDVDDSLIVEIRLEEKLLFTGKAVYGFPLVDAEVGLEIRKKIFPISLADLNSDVIKDLRVTPDGVGDEIVLAILEDLN